MGLNGPEVGLKIAAVRQGLIVDKTVPATAVLVEYSFFKKLDVGVGFHKAFIISDWHRYK
jgi:hypothetical protein